MSTTLSRRTVTVAVVTALIIWFAMSAANNLVLNSGAGYAWAQWVPAGWPYLLDGHSRSMTAGLAAAVIFTVLFWLLVRTAVRGLQGGGRTALFLSVWAASILSAVPGQLVHMYLLWGAVSAGSLEALIANAGTMVFSGLWLGTVIGLPAALSALFAYGTGRAAPADQGRVPGPSSLPGNYGYSSGATSTEPPSAIRDYRQPDR